VFQNVLDTGDASHAVADYDQFFHRFTPIDNAR
jgi:hypothetical protein